jgi:hypothetical protein
MSSTSLDSGTDVQTFSYLLVTLILSTPQPATVKHMFLSFKRVSCTTKAVPLYEDLPEVAAS